MSAAHAVRTLCRSIAGAVVTVALLPAAALAVAPEIHSAKAGKSHHATVVLIHGGTWIHTGAAAMAPLRATASRFQRYGYRTVNLDYRPGPEGLEDVEAIVDAQHRARPDEPVCVYGESAGGHWALMLAAVRPYVGCVIAAAAPTDLTSGLGAWLADRVDFVFSGDAGMYSPIRYAGKIGADVLLAYGADDGYVPPAQGAGMASRLRSSKLDVLAAGDRDWIHGTASQAAIRHLHSLERRWLKRSF
jgi:pimeloyl-ACP methyl ester carboxylesterase